MAMEIYRKKRDFSSPHEPKGGGGSGRGNSFVVQKHDARRLHYDFRLEMDGVLKSWAVTKGPSLVAGEKRLAVHVEDHRLEYGQFEGAIPKGEYGGGAVILWDCGTWIPLGNAAAGYAKGHLEFDLFGEKLKGRWHLVRMHGKLDEKRENWLLIKADDGHARPEGDPDILEERPESVATGRGIADLAGKKPGWSSKTGHSSKVAKTPIAGRSEQSVCYAFDLLHLYGHDLPAAGLVERKAILETLVTDGAPIIRLGYHFAEGGEMIPRRAYRLSVEVSFQI